MFSEDRLHTTADDDQIALDSVQHGDSGQAPPRAESHFLKEPQTGSVVAKDKAEQGGHANARGVPDATLQQLRAQAATAVFRRKIKADLAG
jgi:hypothetical protein